MSESIEVKVGKLEVQVEHICQAMESMSSNVKSMRKMMTMILIFIAVHAATTPTASAILRLIITWLTKL